MIGLLVQRFARMRPLLTMMAFVPLAAIFIAPQTNAQGGSHLLPLTSYTTQIAPSSSGGLWPTWSSTPPKQSGSHATAHAGGAKPKATSPSPQQSGTDSHAQADGGLWPSSTPTPPKQGGSRPTQGPPPVADASLAQGVYEDCSPADQGCLAHLDIMAQSHITIVLNYGQFAGNTTIGEQLAYAAHAAQDGIRVIWPTDAFRYSSDGGTTLAGQFPALSQSLRQQCGIGTMTNEAFVECFAASVAGSAGTWGYYVGDELPISDESMIRHVVDALYHSDAHHPRLYVASDPGGYANTSTLTAYGRPYSDGRYDISDATVIAQDYYPIGTSQGGQAAQYAANIAAGVARLARDFGDRYAMVLQAHSLAAYPSLYPWCKSTAQCPYPTPAQMIAMRNAVVRQGTPQMIMWYSFFNTIGSRWSQDAPAFA